MYTNIFCSEILFISPKKFSTGEFISLKILWLPASAAMKSLVISQETAKIHSGVNWSIILHSCFTFHRQLSSLTETFLAWRYCFIHVSKEQNESSPSHALLIIDFGKLLYFVFFIQKRVRKLWMPLSHGRCYASWNIVACHNIGVLFIWFIKLCINPSIFY